MTGIQIQRKTGQNKDTVKSTSIYFTQSNCFQNLLRSYLSQCFFSWSPCFYLHVHRHWLTKQLRSSNLQLHCYNLHSLLDSILFSHSSVPSQTWLAQIVSSTSSQRHCQVSVLSHPLSFVITPRLSLFIFLSKLYVSRFFLKFHSLKHKFLELSPRLVSRCISITVMFSFSL